MGDRVLACKNKPSFRTTLDQSQNQCYNIDKGYTQDLARKTLKN